MQHSGGSSPIFLFDQAQSQKTTTYVQNASHGLVVQNEKNIELGLILAVQNQQEYFCRHHGVAKKWVLSAIPTHPEADSAATKG